MSEDLETKELPRGHFGHLVVDGPTSHSRYLPHVTGEMLCAKVPHPQQGKEMFHTQTTTATYHGSRVKSEWPTSLPWLAFFFQVIWLF